MVRESRDGALPVEGVGSPAQASPASLEAWAAGLVARAREDGVALTGEGGLLTGLVRQVLQSGLEVELTEHLGYEPHERHRSTGTTRNGSYPKRVKTEIGEVDLRVPRDRDGSFERSTIPSISGAWRACRATSSRSMRRA